jgi:hypothetical protein
MVRALLLKVFIAFKEFVDMRFYSFSLRAISLVILAFAMTAGLRAETIYGITASSSDGAALGTTLVRFNSATPGTITTVGPLTGTVSGLHFVRSIDFRPATGQLYALSLDVTAANKAQLYTVNLSNGALTPVGSIITLGTNSSPLVEMEFNPVTDTIRVVTGANQDSGQTNNFRLTPAGVLTTDPNLDYDSTDVNPNFSNNQLVAAAFTNPSAGQTTLYVWDWGGFDSLLTLGGVNGSPSPDTGKLFTVQVPVQNLTTGQSIGMDISPNTGTLFATHDQRNSGPMGFYTRPLTTNGTETLVGNYPAGTFVVDISVQRATTAAEVTVSGNVVTPTGRGLVQATVTITDSQGRAQSVTTGRGGAFKFDNIEAGKAYFISVQSQLYTYDPQFISVNDAVSGLRISPSSN